MKKSKLVALAAVATALGVLFLALGAFVPVFDYSGIFIASVCIMLPLTKKSLWAAAMSYVATALLSLIFVGGRFEITVSYALFFGLYPMANYLQKKKNINYFVALILKDVWFVLSLVLLYFFFENFIGFEAEWAKKYALYILTFGGAAAFVLFDFMMIRFQNALDVIVRRLGV